MVGVATGAALLGLSVSCAADSASTTERSAAEVVYDGSESEGETVDSAPEAARVRPREPDEPRWYSDVPNWTGVKLYGVGAGSVQDEARLDKAKRRAAAAARRQLRGRLRALFANSVAELLAEAYERDDPQDTAAATDERDAPPEPAHLVTRALLGEPGQPTSRAAQQIDALITPVHSTVTRRTGRRTVTVYTLLDLDIYGAVDILHAGLRQVWRHSGGPPNSPAERAASDAWQEAARALEAVTRERLFRGVVTQQRALWDGDGDGHRPALPQEVDEEPLPEWTERVPHLPHEAAYGLGRTANRLSEQENGHGTEHAAALGEAIHAAQAAADREARLHLRESLWLKVAWMLDEPFEVHFAETGADVSPFGRMRWVGSVARVVAGLALFATERERALTAPRPGETGQIRAYTLKRVELDTLLAHLERELANAEPPRTLDGGHAEPWKPSRKQLRSLWLNVHDSRTAHGATQTTNR